MRLRRVPAIALAIAIVAAAAAFVVRGKAPSEPGPVLVIRSLRASDAEPPPASTPSDGEERAMALAAASMSPAERKRVLEGIDFATTRLEARLSPLGTDFGDDDPVAQLRAFLVPYVPSFTAARALERGRWASADLEVRAAASCEETPLVPGDRCISSWAADAGNAEDRRARFLAWPASHAKRLELGSRDRAVACARHLRARALLESSPIALVLLDDDLAMHVSAEDAELQRAAQRLGRALAANQLEAPSELEAFARAPRRERVAPWLTLSPTQVAVIPRLSALDRDLGIDCTQP